MCQVFKAIGHFKLQAAGLPKPDTSLISQWLVQCRSADYLSILPFIHTRTCFPITWIFFQRCPWMFVMYTGMVFSPCWWILIRANARPDTPVLSQEPAHVPRPSLADLACGESHRQGLCQFHLLKNEMFDMSGEWSAEKKPISLVSVKWDQSQRKPISRIDQWYTEDTKSTQCQNTLM